MLCVIVLQRKCQLVISMWRRVKTASDGLVANLDGFMAMSHCVGLCYRAYVVLQFYSYVMLTIASWCYHKYCYHWP